MGISRIRVVIFVAVFALCGILFLQGYWILRSWQTHIRNYNHRVHQAAVHTANRLEKGHVRRMLKKHRKNHRADRDRKVVINMSNTVNGRNRELIIINSDTIISQITEGPPSNEKETEVSTTWMAKIDEVKLEEFLNDTDLLLKIKHLPIDSIVAMELGKENIKHSYSYELLTADELEHIHQKRDRKRNRVVVPLFRETVDDQPVFLKLTVNNQEASIPAWFIAMIGLSVLFSGAMIWAFWYVITGLIRQKKISEIKSDFINNMTHEFKTPISTISLAVDSIDHEKVINDPERIGYYSSIIRGENKRMNKQVERVLQAAQLEKGKLIFNKKEVDLIPILQDVILSFDLILKEKEGKVVFNELPGEAVVNGDENHLYNVFNNIIDNAVKYCNSAPEIIITVNAQNKNCRIEFNDNGIGMSISELKHLFSRFYRVNQGDLHNVKGFGLGLSYVKYVVEEHGGQISVNSKPNKGSQFVLTFPLV